MNRTFLWIIVLFSVLQVAAVNKAEDPIRDTQTNPILIDEKNEELKDGQKEAPKPSFKLYPEQGFLSDSNLSDEDADSDSDSAAEDEMYLSEDSESDAEELETWEPAADEDKWDEESYNQEDEYQDEVGDDAAEADSYALESVESDEADNGGMESE